MRGYKAAEQNYLTARPKSSRISEDEILKYDYYNILDRSYHLHRNNSVCTAITETMIDYLAGSGLNPLASDDRAKMVWDRWNEHAHINGVDSFDDVYRAIIAGQVESGDILLTTPIDSTLSNNSVRLKVDLVSGGRVKTPPDFIKTGKDDKGNTVIMGVSFSRGREIGYYVIKNGETGARQEDYTYLPKFDKKTGRLISYLMRRPNFRRPNQTRSLPMITPVVNEIEDLASLWDSSLWAAQNMATLSVFFESDSPGDIQSALNVADGDGDLDRRSDNFGQESLIGTIPEGGGVFTAPAGTKANVISPSGNIDRDALFVRTNRYLCAAIGIPAEILLKDFSQVNFSSSKMAMDSFIRMTNYWTKCNSKIFTLLYRLVNLEASLRGVGVPRLTKSNAPKILGVTWVGGSNFADIDPGKISKSETERINNNISSASNELAKRGMNYEDLVRSKALELQIEKNIADEFKIDAGLLRPQNQATQVQKEIMEDPEIDQEEIEEVDQNE